MFTSTLTTTLRKIDVGRRRGWRRATWPWSLTNMDGLFPLSERPSPPAADHFPTSPQSCASCPGMPLAPRPGVGGEGTIRLSRGGVREAGQEVGVAGGGGADWWGAGGWGPARAPLFFPSAGQ